MKKYGLTLGILAMLIFSSLVLIGPTTATSTTRATDDQAEIEYLNIITTIDNNYATTEILEKFENPYNYSLEETFTFEIPGKAFISNFSLTIDNETHYAEIVPKDVGAQKYQDAVVNGTDAGLVESQGKNVFSYSVSLSAYQELIVGLRYEQYLEKTLGGYEYLLPLTGCEIDRNIDLLSIEVTIFAKLHINDVQVENYRSDTNVDWKSAREVKVSYATGSTTPAEDFIINYELAAPPINGTMLNYNDGSAEYFMHIFSPQKDELGGHIMDKDIIFVLDKSGSMQGQKIQQLKEAFAEIIKQLHENDRFNIIMFDSTIKNYEEDLIDVTTQNTDDAASYINNIQAGGSTNINEALLSALGMFTYSETKVSIIVMLTDGLPTEGVTNPETIRENIKTGNTAQVGIFSLGFGFDVDFEFLKAMSLENYGIALRIYEGEDASEQITNFYETISTPLLKGITFEYSESVYEVFPTRVEQLFEGSEVVVVGKYEGTGNFIESTVEATSWDGMRSFEEVFMLKDSSAYDFIPRLWAYAKIRHLLDEIAVEGENESLVENVTNLALEYGFVTPYTSLLVEVKEPDEPVTDDGSEDDWNTDADGNANSSPGGTNPSGVYAMPATLDSDGDGVDDDDDAYPDDPTRWSDPAPVSDPDADSVPDDWDIQDDGDDKGAGDGGSWLLPELTEEEADSVDSLFGVLFVIILIIIAIIAIAAYTRIKQRRLLDHKRRELIYNYIKENPGEHFRGVQKTLGLEVGVVGYHINMLERGEYIKSHQDGMYRRFYPMDAKIDVKLILTALQERILNGIKTTPGISQRKIATKLGVARKVVSYHIKILRDAGFVYVEKQGREALCYPAAGV